MLSILKRDAVLSNIQTCWFWLAVVGFQILDSTAFCTDVSGRFTAGGYVATEQIDLPSFLEGRNDVFTLSARAYLKVSEWGDGKYEFVSDIRDKNDFFGNVDKENYTLNNANDVQARQISLYIPGQRYFAKLGRFPVLEAGDVATDGAELGTNITKNTSVAAFGGLDPEVIGQRYYVFNSDAMDYGAFMVYQPQEQNWTKNLYISNAFVVDQFKSEVDRSFWFENVNYQWNLRSRVFLMSYLDFTPHTTLQDGNLQWQQGFSSNWTSTLNLLAVDVIQYARISGIRELLAASPYREISESMKYNISDRWWTEARVSSGHRLYDGLNKTEVVLSTEYTNFWAKKWDSSAAIGHTENFQSNDNFFRLGVAYFSRSWEFNLDEEYGVEQYNDGTYHSITSEANLSKMFKDDLFFVLGFQNVVDERVKITAGFFKITYRFGSQPVAPLRDGAPPRGRL